MLIGTLTALLRVPLVGLFVTGYGSDAFIALGSHYLSWMALFYLLPAMTNGVQGFFRGMGKMYTTMLGTFLQASLRTVCTYLLVPRLGLTAIAFSCAIGWCSMLLFEVPYYFLTCRRQSLSG